MRLQILSIGAALALAACSGGNSAANDQANADLNATDPNAANMMMTDQNGAAADQPGGMDMNTATNAQTENAMAADLNTNDKDTNLSNGM